MKSSLKVFVLPLFIASCATAPPQPPTSATSRHYKGKVLFDMCGNIAVQFTDGTPRGQMGWHGDGDSMVYNNVFKVSNSCTWGWDGKDSNITFAIVGPEPQQCMQCLAWRATPDSAFSIHVLK